MNWWQKLFLILWRLFGGGGRQPPTTTTTTTTTTTPPSSTTLPPGPPPVRTAPPSPPTVPPGSSPIADAARQLLAAYNQQRALVGVGPLTLDSRLQAACQAHCDWMAATETMSHTGQGGSTVGERATAAGYDWSWIGENIAAGYTSVAAVMQGWIESPGHYQNMVNGYFSNAGFAVAAAPNGVFYWCADLGAPAAAVSGQVCLSGALWAGPVGRK